MAEYQYHILEPKKMKGRMGWFYRLTLRLIGTKITKVKSNQ